MGTYSTSEKTREALITAAGELVAKHGFAKVSTRAIAEKAGENISSIHYHFGGKEQLMKEVVRTATKRHTENPTSEIIKSFENVLYTPEGQSKAVRALVNRFIDVIFSPENPWWYSYVPYQIMKSENSLQILIKAGVIDDDFASLMNFFKIIKPDFTQEQ
ncbi:MAG TPA: TetR/AcrR family transcriptional regulator, partial [Phycisphaerae bacterium]|nr:TetR/AcrR family transcriptional regulator [Phycisphaerae bacterium]